MKKFFLFASVFFIITSAAFSQNREIKTYTLKNGLGIYFLKDETNALVYTEFVCKAGISSQTSSTAGFFPLYTKIFHTSADAEHQDVFEYCGLKSECKADGAAYSADVPLESLDSYLEGLSSCVKSPSLEEDIIKSVYSKMRRESLDYSKSLSGFINSSIDSRIFSKEPWKHDTGIYAPLFNSYSPVEVRSILYKIANDYYVPRNSALFFCGNIDEEKIYELCEKYFGSWKEGKKNLSEKKTEITDEADNDTAGKKFVMISDEFSPQYTQLVVQFTTLTLSQADLLSASFNREDSVFIEKITSGSMNIPGSQYVNASSIQNKDHSRFILQALIEYNSISFPVKQSEAFVKTAKEASILKRKNFIQAQNDLKIKYELQSANSVQLCSTLADFWLMSDSPDPQNFLQDYSRTIYNFQSLNEKEIARKILSEDPYVFVLINTQVYKAYEKQFAENGYELITEKNGSWYTNELLAKISQNEKKLNLSEKELTETNDEENIHKEQAEKYYSSNIESISSFELENGIPVFIKETPFTQTVCIGLKINPKESADSEEFEILSDYIARKCGTENTLTESSFTGTMIVVEVHKDKVEDTLKKISEAIVFNQITPAEADEIFSDYNYKKFLEKGNLPKQMKSKVLYPERGFGKKQTLEDYKKLVETYNRLLDASLYSIIAAGDISSREFKILAEKYFGFIKEVTVRSSCTPYTLEESSKIKNIEIEHTFTTDKSAASAPAESPILIPTKEFIDPAQIYFDSCEYNLAVYNSLLMELTRRTEKKLGSAECTFFEADNSFAGGIMNCTGIKKASVFFTAYKEARNELLNELSSDEKKDTAAKKIKSLWIQKKLSGTKDNLNTLLLLAEGVEKNKAEQYLLDYIDVQNAEAEDYVQLLNEYFTEDGKFKAKSKNN